MELKEFKVVETTHTYSKLEDKKALAIVATTYMRACSGAYKGINFESSDDMYIIAESFQEASKMLIDHTYSSTSDVKLVENTRKAEPKALEVTVVNSTNDCGSEGVEEIYFGMVLIVDKEQNLTVINTKEDGDWRDYVDCDTLAVQHVKLHL